MKKTDFSERQIISILRSQESGHVFNDIYRKHGISQVTFYNWKN